MYSEIKEFLGISNEELNKLFEHDYLQVKENKIFDNAFDFYRKTYYYLFDLINWEKSDKSAYHDAYRMFLRRYGSSIKTVLDYGCGIGTDALFLVKEFGCEVILVDIPSIHLEFAKWRFQKRGLPTPKIIEIHNDTPELVHVDLILCIAVMEHVEHPEA